MPRVTSAASTLCRVMPYADAAHALFPLTQIGVPPAGGGACGAARPGAAAAAAAGLALAFTHPALCWCARTDHVLLAWPCNWRDLLLHAAMVGMPCVSMVLHMQHDPFHLYLASKQ